MESLVYTDNSLVDPWLVAQIIIQNTRRLSPLVAVQPAYMHPYAVAKMVSSLGHLYGRKIYLNMVAGGFKNDLAALNDTTPHDKRYARLVEYTTVIQELLRSPEPVTYRGEFYTVDKLRMTPALDSSLMPGIFVSGSSEAGLAAAAALGATAIKYPQPAENEPEDPTKSSGVRVGIVTRDSRRRSLARGARTLSGRPQGPNHPSAGDENIGLFVASAALGDGAFDSKRRQPVLALAV